MGRTSQRKGRNGELELCRVFQSYGIQAEPGKAVSYGSVPDIVGVDGVHVECKRAETIRLSEWLEQAKRDSERFGDGAPAVFFRRSRSPWCVVMKMDDWMALYRSSKIGKEP